MSVSTALVVRELPLFLAPAHHEAVEEFDFRAPAFLYVLAH